jgi:hypothetical protein
MPVREKIVLSQRLVLRFDLNAVSFRIVTEAKSQLIVRVQIVVGAQREKVRAVCNGKNPLQIVERTESDELPLRVARVDGNWRT